MIIFHVYISNKRIRLSITCPLWHARLLRPDSADIRARIDRNNNGGASLEMGLSVIRPVCYESYIVSSNVMTLFLTLNSEFRLRACADWTTAALFETVWNKYCYLMMYIVRVICVFSFPCLCCFCEISTFTHQTRIATISEQPMFPSTLSRPHLKVNIIVIYFPVG